MCETSGKLVKWLDGELENDEVGEVERHIADCSECQGRLEEYRQVSAELGAYCDALMTAKVRHGVPRWVPVLSGAAVAAAGAALFLALQWAHVEPPVDYPAVAPVPPAIVLEKTQVSGRAVPRRHAAAGVQSQTPNWQLAAPAIQIAFSAESMFPPGAFPEGVNFTADLSISVDGSAQQIRLRPGLIGIERRTAKP
jgi:anti-sigma factor RsiW